MPNPGDMDKLRPGGEVTLLMGAFDPPSMGCIRAMDAILSRGAEDVWLCPLGEGGEERAAMAHLACQDHFSSSGRPAGCCTIALDKGISSPGGAFDACRSAFPSLRFRVAMALDDVPDGYHPDDVVCFHGQSPAGSAVAIPVRRHRASPRDLRERIARGGDASRDVPPSVWEFVQKRRLYR
jgi:nicotinic acid mononucleotide adenylyltransferase